MSKQLKVSILLIVAVSILTFIGISFLKNFSPTTKEAINSTTVELKVQVETAKATNLPLEIQGFGSVSPLEDVTIISEVSGLILVKSPKAYSGLMLKKDEIIFELYRKDLELQLEKIQIGIDKFSLDKKELSIQIEQVANELKLQKEILILSEKELKRMELLSKGDHVAINLFDQAKMQFLQTKIRAENLESLLITIPLKISSIDETIKQSQIQLLEIKERVLKTIIKAPFDCIVKDVFVEAGAIASPGLKLISIYNDKTSEISVNLNKDEEEIVRNCQNPSEIKLKLNNSENSIGDFQRLEGKLATTTKLSTIVFRVNGLKSFRPGELIKVKILVPVTEKYFKVKKEYVSDGKIHLAIDNSLKLIEIRPRFDLADYFVVMEDLKEGDKIIITHIPYAIDGSPIKTYEGIVPLP